MTDNNPFFPKLKVPFERESSNGELIVNPTVKEDYDWVFNNPTEVKAVEKLDGENIRVDIDPETNNPVAIYRRDGFQETNKGRVYNLAEIPLWDDSLSHYTEGIANAYGKGWMDTVSPGPSFGELIGPKVQDNRYNLDKHYWVPFEYAVEELEYESYGDYSVEFDAISDWFKEGLIPLFYSRMNGGLSFEQAREECTPEGVVFVTEEEGDFLDNQMAKLRRSDFRWYYE